MTVHNQTALREAISSPHYVKTTRLPVDKSERKGPILATVKEDGAKFAMILAKRFHSERFQELGKEIAQKAADALGMALDDLIKASKKQPEATWRQAAMFATLLNGKSLSQTIRAFGRTDHTTALHAFRAIQEHVEGCPRSVPAARAWFADLMQSEVAA